MTEVTDPGRKAEHFGNGGRRLRVTEVAIFSDDFPAVLSPWILFVQANRFWNLLCPVL